MFRAETKLSRGRRHLAPPFYYLGVKTPVLLPKMAKKTEVSVRGSYAQAVERSALAGPGAFPPPLAPANGCFDGN